ncbi:MAG TPA: hypothetical protein VMN57_07480, partial [Anaerolineales bacterium]|nr:hypothetical protein [Anaerolineales bacterium]
MDQKYPVLAVLPLHSLVIHEHHDDSRTGPLIEQIRNSPFFINPVIVTPLHDHTARYMVLDGANRTTATRRMGFDHILAQVVEADELGVETQTWNHVVWDVPVDEFWERIEAIDGLAYMESTAERANETVLERNGLAAVHLADGRVFEVLAPAINRVSRNAFLNSLVDTYKASGRMDRTPHRSVEPLHKLYPSLTGLVFMPKLRVRHLSYLVSQGHFLPAGVTRFSVSPRALRVNFPMEILQSDMTLEEKNDALERFIKERIDQKGVRYYAESTVL